MTSFDRASETIRRQVEIEHWAQSVIWADAGEVFGTAQKAVGVVLHGGEPVRFIDYEGNPLVKRVAMTIAFATNSPWWAHVGASREIIKNVREDLIKHGVEAEPTTIDIKDPEHYITHTCKRSDHSRCRVKRCQCSCHTVTKHNQGRRKNG